METKAYYRLRSLTICKIDISHLWFANSLSKLFKILLSTSEQPSTCGALSLFFWVFFFCCFLEGQKSYLLGLSKDSNLCTTI